MPNVIKYSVGATPSGSLRKGNMLIGNNTADYGLTFFNGIDPPSGGYTIYLNKASGGPSIYCPANNTQLIGITNQIAGANYTTAAQCLNYFATQTDKLCVNFNYEGIVTNGLVLNLDAGFDPSYPTTGSTWYDLSGNTSNGTLVNGPTFNSANSGSIVFDGVNDYGTLPSNLFGVANGSNISTLTIDVWVNWNSFPINNIDEFISWWNVGSSTVGFFGVSCISNGGGTNTNPSIRFGDGWQNTGVKFTSSTDTNKWWNLTAVKTSNNAFIYRNGNLEATKGSSMSFTVDKAAAIGCHDGAGGRIEFFNGKMAILRTYNTALSSQEILQNYNAQKARFGL